jgi:DNA-binding MurR/RpiR family transcriptional regulator
LKTAIRLKAAKAAGMKTIVFTNNDENKYLSIADFKILTFESVQLPVYGTELMNQGSFLPVSLNSFILGHL